MSLASAMLTVVEAISESVDSVIVAVVRIRSLAEEGSGSSEGLFQDEFLADP
jgi:hypothetical protein